MPRHRRGGHPRGGQGLLCRRGGGGRETLRRPRRGASPLKPRRADAGQGPHWRADGRRGPPESTPSARRQPPHSRRVWPRRERWLPPRLRSGRGSPAAVDQGEAAPKRQAPVHPARARPRSARAVPQPGLASRQPRPAQGTTPPGLQPTTAAASAIPRHSSTMACHWGCWEAHQEQREWEWAPELALQGIQDPHRVDGT